MARELAGGNLSLATVCHYEFVIMMFFIVFLLSLPLLTHLGQVTKLESWPVAILAWPQCAIMTS